ncbi:uncharacterized protein BDV14DRAFT_199265 [Aspergillus stella-maris]|uniref:uncharacterized protein n=1 Tax=Aspergillus stella-maris TaxID=1810926 RepID=UPI003CCDD522
MRQPLTLIQATFLGLSLLALYTVLLPFAFNGLRHHAIEAKISRNLTSDGGPKLLDTFTGIHTIDLVIQTLVISFWPVVNGRHPALSLLGLTKIGAWGTSYILLALEARRTKSTISVVWRLGLIMASMYLLAEAFVLPIYCAVTLPRATKDQAMPPFRSMQGLFITIFICFYACLTLLVVPIPALVQDDTRQRLVAVALGWPLWVFVVLAGRSFLQKDTPRAARIHREQYSPPDRSPLYLLAFLSAATAHLLAVLAPLVFEEMTLVDIFLPPLPWTITWFSTLVEAMTAFLQWDHVIAGVTLLLWVVGIYIRDFDGDIDVIALALQVFVLSVVASPAGAATVLIWKLDNCLHERAKGKVI